MPYTDQATITATSRCSLFGGAAALLGVAGTAPAAVAASSPILNAARGITVLNQQHDQADVPHADGAVLDRIWRQVRLLEQTILAATPATIAEAMVILMVAAGNLDMASSCEDAGSIVNAAMDAAARATRFLASAAGVSVAEFGGDLYLPASTGRAA